LRAIVGDRGAATRGNATPAAQQRRTVPLLLLANGAGSCSPPKLRPISERRFERRQRGPVRYALFIELLTD
jgi:hypothetical protein